MALERMYSEAMVKEMEESDDDIFVEVGQELWLHIEAKIVIARISLLVYRYAGYFCR